MKIIVIIASALMAFASFGGQQNQAACAVTNNMQATDAIVRYSLEVHRAIANRIMREQRYREERLRLEIERAEKAEKAEKAKTYNQVSAEAFERGRKADEELVKKLFNYKPRKNPPDCPQTPVEAKQKKPRNSLRSYDARRENNRFETSGPARRRK